jgi:hypothetical protein
VGGTPAGALLCGPCVGAGEPGRAREDYAAYPARDRAPAKPVEVVKAHVRARSRVRGSCICTDSHIGWWVTVQHSQARERGDMPTLSRGIVSLTPGIETAFRQRMGDVYGEIIPIDFSQVPLGLLMRFAVLIETGIPVDIAKRGLRGLSRGTYRKEDIPLTE